MTCWRTLPHSVGSISPSPVTTFGLLSGPSLGSGPYAMFAPRSGCRPLKRAVLNKSSGDPRLTQTVVGAEPADAAGRRADDRAGLGVPSALAVGPRADVDGVLQGG